MSVVIEEMQSIKVEIQSIKEENPLEAFDGIICQPEIETKEESFESALLLENQSCDGDIGSQSSPDNIEIKTTANFHENHLEDARSDAMAPLEGVTCLQGDITKT